MVLSPTQGLPLLPAPWLVDTLTAANSSDPFLLITVVNAAAAAFGQENDDDKNYMTSVTDQAGDFFLWVWGIGSGRITATNITFNLTGTNLEHFKIKRQ
jgi:hypothetical protein